MPLTLWTNAVFHEAATRMLLEGIHPHRLLVSENASASVLAAGQPDPALAQADIAFGQPDPEDCLRNPRLRWVEVSSAGYTRYDTPAFLDAFRQRKAAFTNASSVFADPCAQHVLAMMLALARQILPSYRDQLTDHSWHYTERRYHSRLLTGQTVLLLGYGAIGRRLTELLTPFGVKIYALRRSGRAEAGVQIVSEADLPSLWPLADHIVNILPAHPTTEGFVNAQRLAACRADAHFYNIGRGSTVDQSALAAALRSGNLGAAYLDVFEPEPLPASHELWTTPNCFITPHTAGGRHDQDETLVRHFLENLASFEAGKPLRDQIL
ncbi:MAG: hypothetical protein RLZZ399_1030 [Verrucomicrobiota bacterium]